MPSITPRGGRDGSRPRPPGPRALPSARPTVSGMITAGVSVLLLAATSLLLLVPAVFSFVPLPAETAALTLCIPGIGPLHRFSGALTPEEEELTYIHEGVHAAKCRKFGSLWYARQTVTARGRLTLEAHALCAEAAVLSIRGGDRDRLLAWTEETLSTGYLTGTGVSRAEVSAMVRGACATLSAE